MRGHSGTRVGPFELMEELGRGAAASVYRARHVELGREVALKVLEEPPTRRAREVWLLRLRREAAAAARLDHPHIVRVHALHELAGRALLELELVKGEPLSVLVDRAGGSLPPAQALALVEKLALAAHHAHEHGVVHRDLKPANVIIDETGEPRIVDFGMAKDLESAERLSLTGALMGTPSYFAPEQAVGAVSQIDGRTDVWALGVILYELVTGQLPFTANGMLELIVRITEHDPAPPRLPDGRDAGPAGALALRVMQKERAARPSALELAQACAEALRRPARRSVAVPVVLAVVVAGAAALAGLGLARTLIATAEPTPAPVAPSAPVTSARSLADRAAPLATALALALDDPPGRFASWVTSLGEAVAEDEGLREPLAAVVVARSSNELVARFAADRPSNPDEDALADALRLLDGPGLSAGAREGLRVRRAAVAARLCDHARRRLERAVALGEEAGASEREVALGHLWRIAALGEELDRATSRATLDLFELSYRRLTPREGLEVNAVLLALGGAPSAFVRDAPLEEIHGAARDLVRARPSAPAARLAAGAACLVAAQRHVRRAGPDERAAALREARALLTDGPLEWLEAARSAPHLRAIERVEWSAALSSAIVQPEGGAPDDDGARLEATIATAQEALDLGYPRADRLRLVLASLLVLRAERALARSPALAWRDLEQAIAHARGAAAFREASRVEHAQLVAQPPQDAAGARRLTMFVTTRLAAELMDEGLLAEPSWTEARALALQRRLPGSRDDGETRALQRRALEATVERSPYHLEACASLTQVLLELGEDAAALQHLERILALDPRGSVWGRTAPETRRQAEGLRDELLRKLGR